MSEATETRIPVSKQTAKKLKLLKAYRDCPHYDKTILDLIENPASENEQEILEGAE